MWCFALFALGCVTGRAADGTPGWVWLAGCALCAAIGASGSGPRARVALALGAVLLGAGWFGVRVRERAADELAGLLKGVPAMTPVQVRGMLTQAPRAIDVRGVAFELAVSGLRMDGGWVEARGAVRVFVEGGSARGRWRAGERVAVRGFFSPIGPPRNPGERDERLWAAQEGISGRVRAPSPELVRLDDRQAGALERASGAWWAGLARLREGASACLDAAVGGEETAGDERALVGALLLGRDDPALRPLSRAMARLGLVHVLSISGFHLAVMAGMSLFLVRLTGDHGRLEPAIVAGLVAVYLFIVPAQSPVLRSGLMVLGLLAGEMVGRRYDRLNLLGWIGALLLLWRPMDLWTAGFQLSLGVTAVLLWLGRRVHEQWFPPRVIGDAGEAEAAREPGVMRLVRGAWEGVKGLFSSSVLCWAVASPAVLHHVGVVSPLAALTSVLLTPLFTLLLWLGYPALVLGAIWPGGAGVVGGVLDGLGWAATGLTFWLDGQPGMAVNLPQVSTGWTFFTTAVILCWFRWGDRRDARLWWASAAAGAWLAATLAMAGGTGGNPESEPARMDVLATGSGSVVLMRSGDQGVLWLGGWRDASAGRAWDVTITRGVRALGAWRVRTLVIPGGTGEGYGDLAGLALALGVCDALAPEGLVRRGEQDGGSAAAGVLRALRAAGVRVRSVRGGEELEFGHAVLTLDAARAGEGVAGETTAGPVGTLMGTMRVRSGGQQGVPADGEAVLLGALRNRELELALRSLERVGATGGAVPGGRLAIELPPGDSGPAAAWLAARPTVMAWRPESERPGRGLGGSKVWSTAERGSIRVVWSGAGRLRMSGLIEPDAGDRAGGGAVDGAAGPLRENAD